jgi:hypothetical protein
VTGTRDSSGGNKNARGAPEWQHPATTQTGRARDGVKD